MIEALLLPDLITELPAAIRLQRLVNTLRAEFGCGAVVLLQSTGEHLMPLAAVGLVPDALGRRFEVARHPRLAALLSRREPTWFEPGSPLPDPYDGLLDGSPGEPLPVHDCMGVSLSQEGKIWGVLTLDALRPGVFDESARQRLQHLVPLIEAMVRITLLEQENRALRFARADQQQVVTQLDESGIIGRSPAVTKLLEELNVVVDSDLPILLTGETGVGKDVFARWLHRHSSRRERPLVQVNCAALPESLAESELFGHVKGAFSGASIDRSGRFDAAHNGTLLLDEVGELPLSVQAKLLRTLQNGEIQRLGADEPLRVDVRIIAATNRNLAEAVAVGSFRADLYHRLSVYPVRIAPLRERGTDILLLAGHFIEQNRTRLGVRSFRLSPQGEQALLNYSWPGNVRELEHVISRSALKSLGRAGSRQAIITLEIEPLDSTGPTPTADVAAPMLDPDVSALTLNPDAAAPQPMNTILPMKSAVEACQRQQLKLALGQARGNWAAAARLLEIDSSNLHKLAKRLGVKD